MSIACITGASSGIGKEFAKQLSLQGYNLILVSRNVDELKKLSSSLNTKCKIIKCDLSSENACLKLTKKLSHYNINIFINNAGFGNIGFSENCNLKTDIDMINVNVKAVHILTHEMLKMFIKRDSGYILNVASSAGLLPGGPYMATYYATKSYVTSYTSAIYEELRRRNSNVHISALCPGPVDTNFNKTANVAFALKGISARYCAEYALSQMFKNKLIIIPTLQLKLACSAGKLLPRKAVLRACAMQQSKKIYDK